MNYTHAKVEDAFVIQGSLDLSKWHNATQYAHKALNEKKSCVLDFEQIHDVFDSGLAMMLAMAEELGGAGQLLEVMNANEEVREKLLSLIQSDWLVVH